MLYKELDLPFDPWKDLPSYYFDKEKHSSTLPVFNRYIKTSDFNKETIQWFLDKKLVLSHCMIFSYMAFGKSSIHQDGFIGDISTKLYCAINFNLGGRGSINWYDPINIKNVSPPTLTPVASSPYQYLHSDNAVLKESVEIKNPMLINVDEFHQGENLSPEHRYSLTLRWVPVTRFSAAIEIFRDYFI